MRIPALLSSALILPILLSAQSFPTNTDLTKSISLLDSGKTVQAMAVDVTGNVYLAGTTNSGLTGATTLIGPRGTDDIFVIKTDSTGSQILYATLIGGSFAETVQGMKLDANGNVYILGSTSSLDMPFTSKVNPTNALGAFVLKLNAAGTALTYGAQLGSRMTALSFDVDSAGAVYVAGRTNAIDLTTTAGVLKSGPAATEADSFGFVAKLGVSGQSFDIATYYGTVGGAVDYLSVRSNGILIFSSGNMVLLNTTLSQQISSKALGLAPVNATFDSTGNIYLAGTATATGVFTVRKYASDAQTLSLEKTYALRSGGTAPRIAVAPNGRIFLFGTASGPDFPSKNGTQACLSSIAAPNGYAGLPISTGLIGSTNIPDDQAMIIADTNGDILHASFNTSNVGFVAVAPTNGRIYTSLTITLFTQPELTAWRGLVRYIQDTVPAEKTAPSCVAHGATYKTTALSPGTFMLIYGTHLGPVPFTGYTTDSNGRMSTSLGGVTVTVDGKPAVISFVYEKQINFIVPWGTRSDGAAVPVCVTYDGTTSCMQVSTTNVSPGVFPCDFNVGLDCVLDQDYTRNTTKPAKAGEVVQIYMTGLGPVEGTMVDGGFASGTVLQHALGTVVVTAQATGTCGVFGCSVTNTAVGSTLNAPVAFVGAAPTLVLGVNQLNVTLPQDMPTGVQKLTISYTPPGSTIPVLTTARIQVQ